jgi:hypothetical protein
VDRPVTLKTTVILVGAVLGCALATALLSSRFGGKSQSVKPVTQTHGLSSNASDRPAHIFDPRPVPDMAPKSPPVSAQNEFAADDAIVLRAADEHAARAEGSNADRQFTTTFRDLADHFAAEPTTDRGNSLRTEILNQVSVGAGPAPISLQLECRETICRLQLTASEAQKAKTMEDIRGVGAFKLVIGMERPIADGAIISDVYLQMN